MSHHRAQLEVRKWDLTLRALSIAVNNSCHFKKNNNSKTKLSAFVSDRPRNCKNNIWGGTRSCFLV